MLGSPRGLPASSASGERVSLFHVGDLPQWVIDVLHYCVLSDSPSHQSPFSYWLEQPEQCPMAYFSGHGSFQPFHPIPCPLLSEIAVGT